MKGITLVANGQDLGKIATSYKCYHEITYEKIITTQDGTEHYFGKKERPIVEFTLPLLPDSSSADYDALTKEPLMVTFDDPDVGILDREMRLDCNWEKAFAIRNCVDRRCYYSSGTIRLRAKEVL